MRLLTVTTEQTTEAVKSDGTVDKLMEITKSPVFYIVIGAIVLLIIVYYLYRRFVKAGPGKVVVITRKGKPFKLLREGDQKYFMVPFVDSLGATISLNEDSFTSDKLYINNGPEHLYKIDYSLDYKVVDPELFYKKMQNFKDNAETQINSDLRAFADNGNVSKIINEYRTYNDKILSVVHDSITPFGVESIAFRVNYISTSV